jgi:hypothetical protein
MECQRQIQVRMVEELMDDASAFQTAAFQSEISDSTGWRPLYKALPNSRARKAERLEYERLVALNA